MSLTSPEAAARRRRLYPGLAVAAVIAVGVTVAGLVRDDQPDRRHAPAVGSGEPIDPLAYDSALDGDYEARATAGYSHVLYAKSPGGVFATAARVDHLRPLVERAAAKGDIDPDTLEAIVFLESGGRPDVIAGGRDPINASGLTQIVAETGQSLLGMHVDLERSRALTRAARRALARGRPEAAARALALRRRVDERFDPAKALAGAVRYLDSAREQFGRDDLALVSYHMGIGNLQRVIAAYGGEKRPSYVRLFFDSTPVSHTAAWRLLSGFGDDSSTYYWRVLAAEEIMRLYREDRGTLARREELQTNKASAEEILHPEDETKAFAEPGDIADALDKGDLVALPASPARLGFAIDPRMGELAARLDEKRTLYRALRPEALRTALWMGRVVARVSGVSAPLTMTSAVRDQRYQDLLLERNIEATSNYSLHTTGYSFDVRRRYASRAQAFAFQFALDRLQALNLISWVREPAAIHVTAASDAGRLPAG